MVVSAFGEALGVVDGVDGAFHHLEGEGRHLGDTPRHLEGFLQGLSRRDDPINKVPFLRRLGIDEIAGVVELA